MINSINQDPRSIDTSGFINEGISSDMNVITIPQDNKNSKISNNVSFLKPMTIVFFKAIKNCG